MEGERKFIVRPAVERPTGFVLSCATPLLEEEGHPLCSALTTDVNDPISKHRTRVWAALAADDDPVDLAQVERPEVSEQGFYREESKACGRVLERPNARQTVASIFNADTEGHVFKVRHPPQLTRQQFAQSLVALGEDLKQMPVSLSHDLSNATDVVGWNAIVKEVAHRVDENLPRATPVQWLLKLFGHQSEVEALLEGVSRHAAEALREHLRVAELAARAHLRAAANRVPRRVRPLNRRAVAHGGPVYVHSVTEQVTELAKIAY